jgi:hypothetical protein
MINCFTSEVAARPVGSSDASSFVKRKLTKARRHFKQPRMDLLGWEILALVAESQAARSSGADEIPVDRETATLAMKFVRLLPRSMPLPEVAPDPDGEISFDWLGDGGKVFSVSINKRGRLAYAGRFGEESKVHGIEQLSEMCPGEILFGIEKATRSR